MLFCFILLPVCVPVTWIEPVICVFAHLPFHDFVLSTLQQWSCRFQAHGAQPVSVDCGDHYGPLSTWEGVKGWGISAPFCGYSDLSWTYQARWLGHVGIDLAVIDCITAHTHDHLLLGQGLCWSTALSCADDETLTWRLFQNFHQQVLYQCESTTHQGQW